MSRSTQRLRQGLCTFLFIIAVSLLQADQAHLKFFLKGNEAFSEEKYSEAVELYEEVLEDKDYPSVHYNLSRTYTKLRKPGLALYHIRRLLFLEPRRSDARTSLNLLRQELPAAQGLPSGWKRFAYYLSVNEWTLLAMLSLWIFGFTFIVVYFLRSGYFLLNVLRFFSVLSLSISGACLFQLHGQADEAIVLEKKLDLRIAPASGSAVVGSVPEGQSVMALKVSETDVMILDPVQELRGWVPSDSLGFVAK